MIQPESSGMTEQDFREFVLAARWKVAKTMPSQPHSYTLREWHLDETFVEAVKFIRQHGYQERYGRGIYTYYEADGLKYWTMGYPLERTKLINRANVDS